MAKWFFAYPNDPILLGQTIERAVQQINRPEEKVISWKALNIDGRFIENAIVEKIHDHTFIADITILNFNVIYEIGYAIGKGRKILLVRNGTFDESNPTLLQVGIFDTIGFSEYNNSDDLAVIIKKAKPNNPSAGNFKFNRTAPLYIVDSKYKDDFSARIIARVKKAKLGFRSFDPNETPRLSALDAINQVAQSTGIIVSLVPKTSKESKIHNFRAAFVAGLANGMNRHLLILQNGTDPVPIDLRDYVIVCKKVDDVNEALAGFATEVVELMQQDDESFVKRTKSNDLENLNLGASSAENEMRTLHYYYLKIDPYFKVIRGEVQLVVGRKGSGKTAIFLQIRDTERKKNDTVVLDLMPDGYQLIKFKEQVLDYLEEGTLHHTITGFWEYILLLEICHKVLDIDKRKHYSDQTLHEKYVFLENLYHSEEYVTEGDFSERMARLLESISRNYQLKFGGKENVRLSDPQVTGLLYRTDIKLLRDSLVGYLHLKKKIWLLFDNIDKGWPSTGLKKEDLIIIRSLIDASRKVQRHFSKHDIDVFPVVFLRNDVYDLLVRQTSDRQKEAKVLLDWTDPDLLRKMIALRIQTNPDFDSNLEIDSLWRRICESHYKGEDSFNYLIERSLMRPRFLINLITHCRGFAVNLGHKKIEAQDIEKGLQAYSHDLVQDIDLEIQDILPEAKGILHAFLAGNSEISSKKLKEIVRAKLDNDDFVERTINLLLWYGFIGILKGQDVQYIYSLNYDIDVLKALINKMGEDAVFVINPAFWPALLIDS